MAKEKESNPWQSNHLWEKEIALLKSLADLAGLTETVKWGGIVYTYNDKNVLGVGGFKDYFTLWFFKGVFLKDQAKVLINANEENTKSLRQWRFTSIGEVNDEQVLRYMHEAIEVEKAGLEIRPEKRETIIPQQLQEALASSAELKNAFSNLTPFKQREYCEYIETAKQEKTKMARLEKCTPMILQGKGLNDKYR